MLARCYVCLHHNHQGGNNTEMAYVINVLLVSLHTIPKYSRCVII